MTTGRTWVFAIPILAFGAMLREAFGMTWDAVVPILLLGAILFVLITVGQLVMDLLHEIKAFRLDYLIGLDRLHDRSEGPLTGHLDDIKNEIEIIKDVIQDVVDAAKRNAR